MCSISTCRSTPNLDLLTSGQYWGSAMTTRLPTLVLMAQAECFSFLQCRQTDVTETADKQWKAISMLVATGYSAGIDNYTYNTVKCFSSSPSYPTWTTYTEFLFSWLYQNYSYLGRVPLWKELLRISEKWPAHSVTQSTELIANSCWLKHAKMKLQLGQKPIDENWPSQSRDAVHSHTAAWMSGEPLPQQCKELLHNVGRRRGAVVERQVLNTSAQQFSGHFLCEN